MLVRFTATHTEVESKQFTNHITISTCQHRLRESESGWHWQ